MAARKPAKPKSKGKRAGKKPATGRKTADKR